MAVCCILSLFTSADPDDYVFSSEVIIQKGRSEVGDIPTLQKFTVECYDYKPSLKEDMEKASLIISHGGKSPVDTNL